MSVPARYQLSQHLMFPTAHSYDDYHPFIYYPSFAFCVTLTNDITKQSYTYA